jgi:RimJ/RimL family protein N-acetyltransferase
MTLEPLFELRVRTPRLELRLPTDEEIVELYRVAEAGIHPPEEIPVHFPWMGAGDERDYFVGYHRHARESWSPAHWCAHFVTFLDGRPIGSQALEAEDFARRREVETSSWLGRAFQQRGYGFEQRAAVLELAFRGLEARAATSDANVGSASQRISEKLGYRVTGAREIPSNGESVLEHDYRLERDDWRCPVPVELVGLEPALPLFGITHLS